MNRIWGVPRKDWPNFWISHLRSLILLLVLGVMIVVSTMLSQLPALNGAEARVDRVWQIAVTLAFNLLFFLVLFRVLTRVNLRSRDVLAGAIAASIAWTVLQAIGGLYVTHAVKGASNVYGTFALVIGLLVWIYLGAQMTLYCAEINVVRARRLWPRSLVQPPLTEADERALAEGALVERRRPEQHIEITFDGPQDRPVETDASTPGDER
jgi:YihY family inner membrane protein